MPINTSTFAAAQQMQQLQNQLLNSSSPPPGQTYTVTGGSGSGNTTWGSGSGNTTWWPYPLQQVGNSPLDKSGFYDKELYLHLKEVVDML